MLILRRCTESLKINCRYLSNFYDTSFSPMLHQCHSEGFDSFFSSKSRSNIMFPGLGAANLPNGASASVQAPAPAEDGTAIIDLSTKLDKTACYARNENAAYPWTNLFIGDTRLGMQSDADEQLIIHLSFQEFVKVKSIKFIEWNRGANPDMNPVTVHIHVNRNNLGFEDVEDVDPAQSIKLTTADLQENSGAIDLYYVKFQRVKSLTFFIEDNAGGDVTAIGGLRIMGSTVATTNMNDFKKQG